MSTSFQVISWFADDIDHKDDNESVPDMRYTIKVFGRRMNGRSVSTTIADYKPFFYISARHENIKWTMQALASLKLFINNKLGNQVHSCKTVQRKEFWGFTNGEMFEFVRISFHTVKALRFANKILSNGAIIPGIRSKPITFVSYESNIDPYIKFMHGKNITPCGWIELPENTYRINNSVLQTRSDDDYSISHKAVRICSSEDNVNKTAPFVVASFDIECTSATGDFPIPKKNYKQFAGELYDVYQAQIRHIADDFIRIEDVKSCISFALGLCETCRYTEIHVLELKTPCDNTHTTIIDKTIDDICVLLHPATHAETDATHETPEKISRETFINWLENCLRPNFPKVFGDAIIQIGISVHRYGDRDCSYRHVVVLGEADNIAGTTVKCCKTEKELLLQWRDEFVKIDPDIVTGYNILGFDFEFIVKRAEELGIGKDMMNLGRIGKMQCPYVVKTLASSALGENILKYVDMQGRVLVDMMKVLMREFKFETFKLDHVASVIVGQRKNNVSPKDIFRLQKGTNSDRKIVAEYCIQDCELVNRMMIKLEILANNMGMANVCLVPLSFIFMRGQGIKIFSLVLKQCRDDGYIIPVMKPDGDDIDNSFEGALVLEPKAGIYVDEPVTVLDFASLYPSCMISENLSHECIVLDEKYNNIPGVDYIDISYDEGKTCRFAQKDEGIIPRILKKLMDRRRETRAHASLQCITLNDGSQLVGHAKDHHGNIRTAIDVYDQFQKAVMEGLQSAYKISSNSLYGQVGARTSPIHLKDIAACTTATGRKMIGMAKDFIETKFHGSVIYGDTDSIFVTFPNESKGKEAVMPSIRVGIEASNEFRKLLKKPHDLEYEKTFWPFILLSKKRYVGNQYGQDDRTFSQKYMGIVLKRRDNANIVKQIYGGIVNTILDEQDIDKAVAFLDSSLTDLVNGHISFDDLVISKCLKSNYKDPTRIAHKVLAERIGHRSPGNKPQVNDRLQFIYIEHANAKALQGQRIETPEYINEMSLKPDYNHYITNQLMNPITQLFSVVIEKIPGFNRSLDYFDNELVRLLESNDKSAEKCREKVQSLKEKYVEELLFKRFIKKGQVDGVLRSQLVELKLSKWKKQPRTDVLLENMTLDELRADAMRRNVPLRSKLTSKASLLQGILKHIRDTASS